MKTQCDTEEQKILRKHKQVNEKSLQNSEEINSLSPEFLYFNDDGFIPNSIYPVLVYRNVFKKQDVDPEEWFEETFENHGWTGTWSGGIYRFHHYHSNTHEVLGVTEGEAVLKIGGENGIEITLSAGDAIVIPAGVGHTCISQSYDFSVIGAYPNGLEPDLNKGKVCERPKADQNISEVLLPENDPLKGCSGPLILEWKERRTFA